MSARAWAAAGMTCALALFGSWVPGEGAQAHDRAILATRAADPTAKAAAAQDLSARKQRPRPRTRSIIRPEPPRFRPRKPVPPAVEARAGPARAWSRYLIGSAHRITLRGYPAGVVGGLPMDDDPFRPPDPGGGHIVGRADPDAPEGGGVGESTAPPAAKIAPQAENAPAASPGRFWRVLAWVGLLSMAAGVIWTSIDWSRSRYEARRRQERWEAEMAEPPCRTTIRGIALRINGG